MRIKAIADLCKLPQRDRLNVISEGLLHVIENSKAIESSACLLAQHDSKRGYIVLHALAQEEAAKFLILLDAVRCPNKQSDKFSNQLKRFNDHLAKGIYSEYYTTRPATFSEAKDWITEEREQYYLDGPIGVEWIFRNDILQNREESIYVDYVEMDNKHRWLSPKQLENDRYTLAQVQTDTLKLIRYMSEAGFCKAESLEVISNVWNSLKLVEDTHWQDILKLNEDTILKLKEKKILEDQSVKIYQYIVQNWLFPLYSVDLKLRRIKIKDLKKIQDEWYPSF